jgi:HD-GYP domain-containing protein (c-di-GMP phosphodiesterase class II)
MVLKSGASRADSHAMRLFLRDRVVPVSILVGAGALAPGAGLHLLGGHHVELSGDLHFVGVGLTALAAAIAAIALTVVGARRHDGRTVLVGTAFTAMAALLAIHGLATPGILIGYNGVIAFTGAATLPIGGAVLALSVFPALRRPKQMRALLVLQGVLVAGVTALGSIGLLVPSVVPDVPEPGSPVALAGLAAGLFFYAVLILRALKTYLLTRRASDVVVLVGLAWLTAALPCAMLMDYQQLGWWLGHGFELLGIVLVGAPVAADLRRAAQSRPLHGDLRAEALVSSEEAFLGARVRSLMIRLAHKDESTEEHTRRVALLAVQMGEHLGLAPGRLRQLAIGGLLHDIGKLAVPTAILQKPGALTDDEFDVIRRHPDWGDQLLRELGGFASAVHRLVRSHHERLDGGGYPDRLTGAEIDLDTRILTVADVYDALVSPRVYRPAWTHEHAIALLHQERGTAFDARCVEALEAVLAGAPDGLPAAAAHRLVAVHAAG